MATAALLIAVPFAVAGVVGAGSPPVRRLAWTAVALWAAGAAAYGWGPALFMDEFS